MIPASLMHSYVLNCIIFFVITLELYDFKVEPSYR